MAECSIGTDPGSTSQCCAGTVTIDAVTYPDVLDPTCKFCDPEGKASIVADPADPFYKLTNSLKAPDHDTGIKIGIVTEEVIDGSGQFDKYMRAGRNQLNTQYELGRIKGADYTNAYIAMQEGMMAQANQFILGKYQADVALAQAEVDAGIKKAKAIFEINLLKVQAYQTELEGLLIAQKIETEQLQQQMLATQEEEARKNGEAQRVKLEQDIQTSATQEQEARKNGEAQRTKLDQDIQLSATQEIEARSMGVVERQLKTEQSRTTVAETELKTVQKTEMGLTGQVDRAAKKAQVQDTLAASGLKATQQTELIANGSSKRALENGQNKVGAAQCELYAAQAAGFGDRNRNDTFKTIMNAWAVDVAENDNTSTPSAINGAPLSNIMNSAVSNSDGLSIT